MRKLLPLLAAFALSIAGAYGQCPTGYTAAALNWDALEYFPTGGYTGYALSGTMSPNQSFAFGKNRLTITYAGCTSAGENGTHTGAAGDDVQYKGDGTVTLTFASEVTNLKFSVYDIDQIQRLKISASNAANVSQNIAVTTLGTTILSLTGNNSTGPMVADNTSSGNGGNVSSGTVVAASSLNAAISVDIAGPVKTITLTTSNTGYVTSGSASSQEDGSFWLSDISACVNDNVGSFPTNYYAVSKPFTGMPGYVLVAINNSMYQVDPATGVSKLVFSDGANSGTINSLAYDPYNKVAYFCWSLTNNGSTTASSKVLRKYDFTTGNVTSVANDVNDIGIPTFNQGTESGAAAFYDGALYLGVEGGEDDGNGGKRVNVSRESIVWRLDFNAGGNPTVTQAYSVDGDKHDFGDFSIKDGMLYDFNGDATYADYQHFNLQTGAHQIVNDVTAPKQSAVGWDGTIYWVSSTIAAYNMNGGIGSQKTITSTPTIPNWTGSFSPSFGDAAEAFRPAVDFGDAPIEYDLDPLAPALHEKVDNLRLGATTDVEWTKPDPGTEANVDGSDEDGLAYATIMNQGGNYQTNVSVFNNTGTNATLIAWLDIDGDKVFEPSEAQVATVTPGSSSKSVSLFWPNTITDLPNNSYTYLRLRLTTATTMTTSTPSGYAPDGEVEDWRVLVTTSPLAVKLTGFEVKKTINDKVSLTWSVTEEEAGTKYEVEKGSNGQEWSIIHSRSSHTKNARVAYENVDQAPFSGANYYRLKITNPDGSVIYSAIKKVVFEKLVVVQITPNPAAANARLSVQSAQRASAHLRVVDMNGRAVYEHAVVVEEGSNAFTLPVQQLPAGIYQTEVWIDSRRYTQQLIVRK